MNVFLKSIYYQILISLRIKQSVFYGIVFPSFIFVVFSSIFGANNPDYIKFIVTGICAMTIVSDGIFAIGVAVKQYYLSGIIRIFKTIPYGIMTHILSLITARIIQLVFSFILLFGIAHFCFNLELSIKEYGYVLLSIILGLALFSFLGLLLMFVDIKSSSEKGLVNFVYFGLIFLSNTFYPITEINPRFEDIISFSPITPLLELLRGSDEMYGLICIWLLIFILGFYICFNRFQIKRNK